MNNRGEVPESLFGILAIIGVVIAFTALAGGYDDLDWSQVVPLFKILIPYLFVVGFPVLIILVAVFLVKSSKTGFGLVTDLFKKPEEVVRTSKKGAARRKR